MPQVIIRDLPAVLHRRLKQEAVSHHRSMNREIISIIEKELGQGKSPVLPQPVKGKKETDSQWIVRIIREARDGSR